MKKLIFTLILIGTLTYIYSQSTLLWSENFEVGLSNYYSYYPSIKTDNDTIKVIGRKNTSSGQRLLIVNYDLNGDTLSTLTYGNDSVYNSIIIDFKFDSANYVYILQKEQLGFYKSKIVLQKYSISGSLIWVEQIQNSADTSYTPRSLGLINDTCLFITGYKEYDYPESGGDVIYTNSLPYIYSYNSNGVKLWEREFNGNSEIDYFLYDIFVHNNTAFLFGFDNSSVSRLVKITLNNVITVISTGLLNGVNNVQLTPDNNLLIASGTKYRITKITLNGTQLWTTYYGTNLPNNVSGDEIRSMVQDNSGNIYLTGRHYADEYGTPNYTNADILTLKYDNNGNQVWQNRYEYGISNADIGNVVTFKDGNVYVGGESQRLGAGNDYDYIVLKMDSVTGLTNGVYRYDGAESGNDAISSVSVLDNGNVALTGLSYINSEYYWTTQLLSDVILSIPNFESNNNFEIYPNPIVSGEYLTIKGKGYRVFTIFSSIGQIIKSGNLTNNESNIIKLDNIKSGIYFLHLENDNEGITRKIIVK